MSDHLLVDFTINCKPPKANEIPHKVYVFKKAKPEVIKSAINDIWVIPCQSNQGATWPVSDVSEKNNKEYLNVF